jgi:ADP-ribose pyrophosphatase YjhB (NUDIX family)
MNIGNAVATLEAAIGNPQQGLPEEIFLFASRIMPVINVDLLIQDPAGRTLLTWRDDEYFGRGWHVPGGVIRYKEMAADRIRACAREELSTEVAFEAAPLMVMEYIGEKPSRAHCISLLYRCTLLSPPAEHLRADRPEPRAGEAPRPGEWRWHAGCPPELLAVQAPYRRFF